MQKRRKKSRSRLQTTQLATDDAISSFGGAGTGLPIARLWSAASGLPQVKELQNSRTGAETRIRAHAEAK